MNTKTLANKRLAMLGLGVENYFLVKWLVKHRVQTQITVCDQRSIEELGGKFLELNKYQNVTWQLGADYNKNLDRYDILFRSPGWPMACSGIKAGLKKNPKLILTSPMKLFMELSPCQNIIGVTGTKGKGTTSSLITAIIKKSRTKVYLGGNIGTAPFSFFDKLKKDDYVVLELSSFQLEDMHVSPKIAVMTNFTPEHLAPADPNNPNYHKNLSAYWLAKFNLAKWQGPRDILVINEKLKNRLEKWELIHGKLKQRVIYFGKSVLKTQLPGEHNLENIAAAEVVAKVLKIEEKTVKKAVLMFKGLEHRIELAGEVNGVKYYDDSFATTPEAAVIAIKSFAKPITLIAGGADKGSNFKEMAKEIKKSVKFICLLKGAGTVKLAAALQAVNYPTSQMKEFGDLKTAMMWAKKIAKSGEIVLMSTGCASFGMFKNYKERGAEFKKIVKEL